MVFYVYKKGDAVNYIVPNCYLQADVNEGEGCCLVKKSMVVEKIVRRTIWFVLLMLILSLGVFYLSRLAPSDPLQSFYGDAIKSMSTQELDAARERLGLGSPHLLSIIFDFLKRKRHEAAANYRWLHTYVCTHMNF